MTTRTHELKCWPQYYEAIVCKERQFEIRRNDRDFGVGDRLILRELDPTSRCFTGRECHRMVSYITDFPDGLREGYVCMGLA